MVYSIAIVYVAAAELARYPRNARRHPPEQLIRLADSLRRFGFVAPVLIDADYTLIAGHGRLAAALSVWDAGEEIPRCERGMVPALLVEHLTPQQVRAYRIADNKLAALSYFDDAALSAALRELTQAGFEAAALGFDDDSLRRLTAEAPPASGDVEFRPAATDGVDPYSVLTFSVLVTPAQRAAIEAHLVRLQGRCGAASPGHTLVSACRRFTLQ